MERNKGRNSNMVYGICTNTGGKKDGTPCSKCQNKEIQAVRASKEFVCEECGEPLQKVNGPGPKPPKWLFIILALVVIGGGIGVYFGFFRGADDHKTPDYDEPKDTVAPVVPEREGTDDTAKVGKTDNEPPKGPDLEPKPPQPKDNYNVGSDQGWYVWYGDCKDGMPHGTGRMKITQSHTIELVDITGSKITVYPGETINAMFDNGRLRGGDIIHKDGSSTTFVNNF